MTTINCLVANILQNPPPTTTTIEKIYLSYDVLNLCLSLLCRTQKKNVFKNTYLEQHEYIYVSKWRQRFHFGVN